MKSLLTLILLTCFSPLHAQTFTVIDSVPQGAYGNAAWGDYNNDGFKDVAYLSQVTPAAAFLVYTYNGSGFTQVAQLGLLFNPGVCWGDLNNDGFDDLVVNGMDTFLNSVTYIYQSLGNGSFQFIPNTIEGLSAGAVAIADYNNDGLKDIAVTGFPNSGIEEAHIYKNTGNFNFTDINASLTGIHFGELKWADLDNDGLKDLVINGITNDFRTRIYKNMGQDSFALQNIYMKGTGGTVDLQDFDGDGWVDILVAGYDSTSVENITELHHNNQNGTFTTLTPLPIFGEPVATDIGDFNNDGMPDICFMGGSINFPNASAICYNTGNNTFNWTAFMPGVIMNSIVAAADFDNDGDDDLFFGEKFLRNDGVTAVSEQHINNTFIYPNPATDYVVLNDYMNIASIRIYNSVGQLVIINNKIEPKITISSLPDGFYSLEAARKDGTLMREQFIK